MANSIAIPNGDSNGSNPMVSIATSESSSPNAFLNWNNACDRNSQCSSGGPARKVVWSKGDGDNGNGQTWTVTTNNTSDTDSKVVDRVELFFGDNTPSFHLGDRIHPFNPMHAHSIYKKLSSYRI